MSRKYKEIIILLFFLLTIFKLYIFTMLPVFKNNDSPETTTSAYTLGIGHPPGYPLFILVGKIFTLLPVASPGFRMNMFASFIAAIVLLLSFYLIKQNVHIVFDSKNNTIVYLSVFVLAFSCIFWNQAIEAKGGIYILNLLFFVILLYLCIKLLKGFNIKYLYLMSFIYGISLTNHWPSIIILLPIFGYFFLKYYYKLNSKNIYYTILFLILGISPYIYLPIRTGTNGIFIFMAKPDTWENFWWMIFRSGYTDMPAPSIDVYKYQIKEFFNIFFNNFSYLWILIFFGIYSIWKKNKEIFFIYLSTLLIIIFMVIGYNRSPKILLWVIDIFLLPVEYILVIFIMLGSCFILQIVKKRIYRYLFSVILVLVIIYLGLSSYKVNNARYNYLSYDFGNNVLKTIEPGCFYLPEGDYYIMPISYFRIIEHKATDINYFTLYNLSYDWGISDFIKRFGQIDLEQQNLTKNVSNIINNYAQKRAIYFTYDYSKQLKGWIQNYFIRTKGILYIINTYDEFMSPDIFKNYSYRSIFDVRNDYDKDLVSLYSERLFTLGNELFERKNYKDAIKAFKYALLFPENSEFANICYNLSFAYKELNDTDNQIEYLKKTIKAKQDYYQAYELLGTIYYNKKLWPIAKDMLEKAIQYGSENKIALQQYINQIGNIDMPAQCEAIFSQAVILLASNNYLKALDLFDFLLEYHYRTVDIYKNLGVYNFKYNNYNDALDYFQKVKEWGDSSEIDEYIAYTYFKMNQIDKSLAVLRQAINIYSTDTKLLDLYNKIEQENKAK